ncbi:toll/interleukin-1 receptor domain-containing protein [Mucilaginibacter rubeus]|uniref:Toll/interleukin-1 receptor domain-containing protein n=1 Tax=Mucilaginibacter rubeus TaxID=2027860 RepID=A0A5C1I666_9SPHI|nr:toll/interleukin-1 receptor domain-containing protein [Mucilaginibacter rubeus]QEM12958.1 toll/interleukin-1 receptor domain-containing protein [Mucilaginibacter rubeus]
MEEEAIIRQEAKDFHRKTIEGSRKVEAIDDFHELKHRLYDFYSPESKAIFLDEIEKQIVSALKAHRDKAHGGLPGINCMHERKPEKLLFYIKQELDTLPIIAHQKNEANPTQVRDKVFVSYSHLDKEFLTDIQRHFKPFLNKIDFWDDSKILPGQKWKDEIKKAIDATKVAILLVSTDFLGSDFIATDELPPLLKAAEENGAVILMVVVKPCLFEEFPSLNQYQAMNPPSNPVIKMDYSDKEELFVNLVRQTKRVLDGEAK